MSGLRRLLKEIHRRSLWQTLLAFLGVSFAVLEGIDLLIQRVGLPDWLFNAALVLLAIGLPIVLVTAFVQGGAAGPAQPEPLPSAAHRPAAAGPGAPSGAHGLFTWRNAIGGGVVAFALWGVVATGWLVLVGKAGRVAEIRELMASEIERLAEAEQFDSAQALLVTRLAEIPGDSVLESLWPLFSEEVTIDSEPSGAQVFWKPYTEPDAEPDEDLGITPVEARFASRLWHRVRFEKDGFRSLEHTAHLYRSWVRAELPWIWLGGLTVRLDGEDVLPEDMVRVRGGRHTLRSPGLEHVDPVTVGDYFIDKHEVTNRDFKRFVDAGGYEDPQYWADRFSREGQGLSWEQARDHFMDGTGRPGPSTWEAGDYPEGQDEYPVTGVSWYEADAYARFVGKHLPTIYHWNRAAETYTSDAVVPFSNFDGAGPAAVGEYPGLGAWGTYDMAGNVREWCSNASGDDRYILGGGWNDEEYHFVDAYTQPPFDRSPTNGFRLVQYLDEPDLASAARPIERPFRDFYTEEPVSDEVYPTYLAQFAYDPLPLEAVIERSDSTSPDWIRETVTFDAAYGDERVIAQLFLPRNVRPPYQSVVFFPGSGAIFLTSSEEMSTGSIDFVIKSGRAVIWPVYKGTFERGDALDSDYPDETVFYKDHVIMWAKDLSRSVDYLESREDIDAGQLSYYGVSWGGAQGGLMVAVEPRFKAAVLFVAGLTFQRSLPEVDPFHYLSRITTPVLMLNGEHDFFFPRETSQEPMFALLGTSPEHRRYVVYPGSHFLPRPQLIRETLDWLDRYLGPVREGRDP